MKAAEFEPTTLSQLAGQASFVEDAKRWVESGEYPNAVLLHGPPGTGKTTAMRVLFRALLGDFYDEVNYMITNASDDRGIDFVRDLKSKAQVKGVGVERRGIGLDEADGLTPQAQDAMRGIMEKYASKVLFILTANYADKIRPAIKSRCTVYTFRRVSAEHGASHLTRLTESCGVPVDWEPYYGDVVEYHGGDLRAAVASLERIPKTADAIKQFTVKQSGDEWWDFTISNKWNELREHLIDVLHSSGDKLSFMNNFHRAIRKHFDNDADTTFAIMEVWGDMMKHVYDWGGSGESYVEVLVARLKKQIEVKT
jgi:DNA polymerase III delta prime subunit